MYGQITLASRAARDSTEETMLNKLPGERGGTTVGMHT